MSSPPPPPRDTSGDAPITSSHDMNHTSQSSTANGQGDTSQPVPSFASSHPPPMSSDPRGAGAPPQDRPRMPWHGPIPSFFIMGPNGSLIPHFHPRPTLPPSQPSTIQGDAPLPALQPTAFPFPGFTPANGPPHPLFSTFIFGGPPVSRPNPQAAAELLRSLPTVSRGLFRRVDNVVKAEQDIDGEEEDARGWKCGICLEGVEENSKETGVKALPCNHLFHGDCLEPWFTTNHTCPTCRLDLDPGRTLRNNPPPGPRRPVATGSGRQSPHPYNRQPNSGQAGETVEGARPTIPPFLPSVGTDPSENEPNEITFIWRMPNPLPTPPPPMRSAPAQAPSAPTGDPSLTPTREATTPAPSTPTISFELPFTASPGALPTAMHSTPPPTGSQANAADSGAEGRPQPERRPHFNVVYHHLPVPGHHHHPIQSSPHLHHHIQHHHLPRPSGESTPYPAASTPPPAPDHAPSATLQQEGSADLAIAPLLDGEGSTSAAIPEPTETPSTESNVQPHFHFFLNFFDAGSLPTPPLPPVPPPRASDYPQQQQTSPPTGPTPPIERPSLTAWVEERERRLGWRCDAPDCGIAPTDEEDDDLSMFVDSDKEMIPIYSERQPASAILNKFQNNNNHDCHDHDHDHNYEPPIPSFELHACPHRWHRACLESVELSSGRPMRVDEEGRCWVRCERCRTDGWIRGRLRSMSESAVERMVLGP